MTMRRRLLLSSAGCLAWLRRRLGRITTTLSFLTRLAHLHLPDFDFFKNAAATINFTGNYSRRYNAFVRDIPTSASVATSHRV